jgi:hypothetical protein
MICMGELPNLPQEPASAAAALAADGHRRWPDMFRLSIALTIGLAAGACRTPIDIEGRLLAMPREPGLRALSPEDFKIQPRGFMWLDQQPDVRGQVVALVDDRVAVRLDADSEPVPGDRRCSMALYSDRGYLGELLVIEVIEGHALGIVCVSHGKGVQVGDRASCRAP